MFDKSCESELLRNLEEPILTNMLWQLCNSCKQARVVCLICIPEARGLRVDISGRPRVPVLQLLCNTSFAYNWLH